MLFMYILDIRFFNVLISMPANSFIDVNEDSFPPSVEGKNIPLTKKKKKRLRDPEKKAATEGSSSFHSRKGTAVHFIPLFNLSNTEKNDGVHSSLLSLLSLTSHSNLILIHLSCDKNAGA